MKLPAILYLALLDRLADSWYYGALGYPDASQLHTDTLGLIEALPGLARMPRCATIVREGEMIRTPRYGQPYLYRPVGSTAPQVVAVLKSPRPKNARGEWEWNAVTEYGEEVVVKASELDPL